MFEAAIEDNYWHMYDKQYFLLLLFYFVNFRVYYLKGLTSVGKKRELVKTRLRQRFWSIMSMSNDSSGVSRSPCQCPLRRSWWPQFPLAITGPASTRLLLTDPTLVPQLKFALPPSSVVALLLPHSCLCLGVLRLNCWPRSWSRYRPPCGGLRSTWVCEPSGILWGLRSNHPPLHFLCFHHLHYRHRSLPCPSCFTRSRPETRTSCQLREACPSTGTSQLWLSA